MRAHERGQKRSGQRNFLQISLFPVSWEGSTNIFSGFVFQVDDPLWDGQNCNPQNNCCDFNRPPYFINDLGLSITTDSINARICLNGGRATSDGGNGDEIFIEQIEVYVAPGLPPT